jgi:sulfate adenylyltransferase
MITSNTASQPTPLFATPERAAELKAEAVHLPSWFLTPRQVWDIELLLSGAFSPLSGFLGHDEYRGVLDSMRLADGRLWPMPIMLDVSGEFAAEIKGKRFALRHPEGMVLGVMTATDVWKPDLQEEATKSLGTVDDAHPGVFQLLSQTHPMYVGGAIEGIETPPHHTFKGLRHTPVELRALFAKLGWKRIVGFQTRNPLHRAHVELTKRAMAGADANLLLQPVVGRTSPGDVDYFSRVRCYQAVLHHYPKESALLNLLPLAMRMGGPREAVWHALIRANYGCTHFIVGRDHAGPRDRDGKPFYGPYDALELAKEHHEDMGVEILGFEEMVYSEETKSYHPRSEVPADKIKNLSGTDLRKCLREGTEVPEWFSYPEVVAELRARYPDRAHQGFTVFFTGLSGAGKSTIANILLAKLMEIDARPATLLDGDIVRKNLSSELTFSKEHRDLNIQRIGFVAGEITKNRGIAICAPIAPYRDTRREVREVIEHYGGFIECFVSTPIAVCEERDRKGLYSKARAGLIKGFTGIDDPYEAPERAELVLDASKLSAEEAAQAIIDHLRSEGYLARPEPADPIAG